MLASENRSGIKEPDVKVFTYSFRLETPWDFDEEKPEEPKREVTS